MTHPARQISMFRGATKREAWALCVRCRGAIRFEWHLRMRWIALDPDGDPFSGVLIEGATPPKDAVPDLYDRVTREILYALAKLDGKPSIYAVVDELCSVRLCSQPDLDARDKLRRRAEQHIRDHRIARSELYQRLGEIAEALDATKIGVWDALRLGCPP